jgi:hypothetical protein
MHLRTHTHSPEHVLKHTSTDRSAPCQPTDHNRVVERLAIVLPARLTWKDRRGATRFASVMTRNVSEFGVYVECQTAVSIPLYRLVQFQLERDVRESDGLPHTLRHGRVLSAVYRIATAGPKAGRHGLALRLIVEPQRQISVDAGEVTADTRASA